MLPQKTEEGRKQAGNTGKAEEGEKMKTSRGKVEEEEKMKTRSTCCAFLAAADQKRRERLDR